MNLNFDLSLLKGYGNNSQIARVLTESWVEKNIFCPNCASTVARYNNNTPVLDFYCVKCKENFELKSKNSKTLGKKIIDGSYKEMIKSIESKTNPTFFFLNYNKANYEVINFLSVPSFMFVPSMIIPRCKGIPNRPNYIMCNIDISGIPSSAKIFYVRNGQIEPKSKILEEWQKTTFLKDSKTEQKGWLIDIMLCIDKIGKKNFTLQEMYSFVPHLKAKHPNNNFIKDKIRQQLQVLRDKGYLEFRGDGSYKLL